jgi:hypothetical protein
MNLQDFVVGLIVIAAAVHMTWTLLPSWVKARWAVTLSRVQRRETGGLYGRLCGWLSRRMVRAAGCSGCASGGPSGAKMRELQQWMREHPASVAPSKPSSDSVAPR